MSQKLQRQRHQAQTSINIGYLLLSFPLGICYFILIVMGIIVTALNLFLIGIPLLILFMSAIWKIAAFERQLVIRWLHVSIAPMAAPFPAQASRIQRGLLHLRRTVTWKSILYLFLKFPFGILAFYVTLVFLILCLALCLISAILGLLVAPFVYFYMAVASNSTLDSKAAGKYIKNVLTGAGMAFFPLIAINFLASLWSQFAQAMLGMNENAMRLAEATALAERERLKAERAEQSRRELIMNVSHDLRTPVASIRGHLEALLLSSNEQTLSPAMLYDYLQIAHRETMRLGVLVEDLLSLARNDSHELRLQIDTIDAGAVIEEVYQIMMPLARRERKISLIREIPPQLPAISADRQRLIQVVLNLVRNAITYTPDGGIVAISLQQTETQYITLSVADTGIGISQEEQQHIFERFYRTDASRTRSSGGFGLGLAIVQDFIQAMGGTISVESTPGVGSTFHLQLKIAPAIASTRQALV
ncbi:sensor histidine kinase [Dictyobacter kobayashii]|uniref:histidine kinase n=1 Tax=Dictyobacter kobayashii TaxID=2014872 RepID=A0A402AHN5_9CHLR|nr:ATP-binding protein [Dictyobacter kobayashii]GCE18609.1 hypothetical protein KDK_24090 [Dictyobacter kobayashii]